MELLKELGQRIQKARKEKKSYATGTRRSEPCFAETRSKL